MNVRTTIVLLNKMVEQGVLNNYAIGGAVAAANYIDLMPTMDVDVFVHIRRSDEQSLILDPTPIFDFLAKEGCEIAGEYFLIDGWPVQFLGPPGELGNQAMDRAVTVDADGEPTRILRAEDLAAIALETGRPKDKARLLALLEGHEFDREMFEETVSRFNLGQKWVVFKRDFEIR